MRPLMPFDLITFPCWKVLVLNPIKRLLFISEKHLITHFKWQTLYQMDSAKWHCKTQRSKKQISISSNIVPCFIKQNMKTANWQLIWIMDGKWNGGHSSSIYMRRTHLAVAYKCYECMLRQACRKFLRSNVAPPHRHIQIQKKKKQFYNIS